MNDFNPNDIGVANGHFYGLPYTVDESDIVLVSVPWDVTTSYAAGTAGGPRAILDASLQVDLFDEGVPEAWKTKIGTYPIEEAVCKLNKQTRKVAEEVIGALEKGDAVRSVAKKTEEVNGASGELNRYVYTVAAKFIAENKRVGIVGGEHSVPFGLIKALSEKYASFGILHIDAHADLREAYEGFTYSHASIMFNVLRQIPQVSKICQVAVRDFCQDEYDLMTGCDRVVSFTDRMLHAMKFKGEEWDSICDKIVARLPEYVYVSFDIDGLSPQLCPHTGTPVPGGLSFSEATFLLEKLTQSGKKIIGFDLCEVAPGEDGEWDANVGARLLFKLCLYLQSISE